MAAPFGAAIFFYRHGDAPVSNDATFFRQQAVIQRNVASEATLENVRVQSERAAASWDVMASRAERTEKLRADRQAKADSHDLPVVE